MELHLWRFKLEINVAVGDPVGTLKPDIQMQTFLIWGKKIVLLFLNDKNQNLLDIYTRIVYLQTGKNTK